jgi:hypothetical protein
MDDLSRLAINQARGRRPPNLGLQPTAFGRG